MCGPQVRVRGGFLDIAQRHPSIQRGGDEHMPQRVRGDDPGAAGGPADDPPGGVPVRRRPSAARNTSPSVRSPMTRSSARAVRGASGMVTTLPPLRVMVRVRWPRSRPGCSMSARRTANSATDLVRHQLVNWRRSRAYASRVRPR